MKILEVSEQIITFWVDEEQPQNSLGDGIDCFLVKVPYPV